MRLSGQKIFFFCVLVILEYLLYRKTNIFIVSSFFDNLSSEACYYNNQTENCCNKIWETQQYLKADEVIFNCEALEVKDCAKTYQRWAVLPIWVWFSTIIYQVFWPGWPRVCLPPEPRVWPHLANILHHQPGGAGVAPGICYDRGLWPQEYWAHSCHNI